jgi:N-acetylneuraminic acid mutarotase
MPANKKVVCSASNSLNLKRYSRSNGSQLFCKRNILTYTVTGTRISLQIPKVYRNKGGNMKRSVFSLIMFMLVLSSLCWATITWTQKTDMPTGRDGLGIGVVEGIVYCIGGWTAGSPSSATGTVEAYDPASDSWSTKASMPTARGFLATCVLNDTIYAIGGWNNASMGLKTVEAYDPVSNSWTTKTSMQTGRNGLGAEVVNGRIYALGGYLSETNVVEEYDPVSNLWTYKTSMPTTRFYFASEVINDRIYIAAGRSAGVNLGPTYEYDPVADTAGGTPWQIVASVPTPRYHPEAAIVQDRMYVCGGLADSDLGIGLFGICMRAEVATVEVYDAVQDTWMVDTPMGFARRELDVGSVGNKLYAIGGWPSGVCYINEEGEVAVGVSEEKKEIVFEDTGYTTELVRGPFIIPKEWCGEIYDITGKRSYDEKLKAGIYFLKRDRDFTRRIIVIK